MNDQAIFSPLAADPIFSEIVALFVAELPQRVHGLEDAWNSGNRNSAQRFAHQLKGAAGSYGFGIVSDVCCELEFALIDGLGDDAIAPLLQQLHDLIARISPRAATD